MPNAEVQKMVRQGLNDLCQIDDSRISPVLLFPVFVIGFACVEDETRQQVSALFEKLIGFSGFGNVRLARDVAHQWWSNYDSGDYEGWNWTQQMDIYRISIPLT
ncbi:hypothetical protein ASPVEDRAFT_28587 [Aspergillus versicolor CBS 583.65]|uniref:Uncharacterized protein n=1 Tax=Aspergillus versicolor CBS 583.65 TaxID=1036611 RepID=A0A1L9PKD6_ASPVE|nr:uncharacterized protein ASPVEDRAFT_28587 [Aspergillus versicolor CBS 583.65]OJJ01961.1 hypothetical protein ASPVEDRAFT_28587 [Aspergillus versicolor CBS 583.65]